MTTVDHDKEIPAVAVRSAAARREMHAIDLCPAIVVNHERIKRIACKARGRKGPNGPDVLVMIPGEEIMGELAHLDLREVEVVVGVISAAAQSRA